MVVKVADNIISPLGLSTEENFESILQGNTMLSYQDEKYGLQEGFVGSLFDRKKIEQIFKKEIGNTDKEYTFFEKLCLLSAAKALAKGRINPMCDDVVFILSTTKGNVELLEKSFDDSRCLLAESARRISSFFGNANNPLVVSNACISGVHAQISAARLIMSNRYRHAVVIGCDVLSKFIVSGFQSFKAMSENLCRPFDINRSGLNLGEAAATLILSNREEVDKDVWSYVCSSVHNDANHISGPSRTGEGSFRVLKDIMKVVNSTDIAFINMHGTATVYNDEMESIALNRCGLDEVPVNGLKGFYGHTLGAAGVLETILSMKAVDEGIVVATKGFEEKGTSHKINLSNSNRFTDKKTFIKMMSGFGGTNAGISYRKG